MPRVFGTLRPLSDGDQYPVIDVDVNAKGFTRVVADENARNAIPAFLRSASMLVFQRDTGQIWSWSGAAWQLFAFNGTGFTFDAAAVVSGTLSTARLGSGSATSGTFLRGSQVWSALAVADLPSLTSAQLASLLTDETGSGAAVFGTSPTITGGAVTALTAFGVRSTGAAFDLRIASSEALSANRTLSFVLGNADRSLTVGSSASVSGSNTGDQTITLTGDVTGSGTGSFAATIAANSVTLAKMAQMATASILGRSSSGTGNVEVLSASTARSLLSVDNVENTALSTWSGSANLTTVGTVASGTWAASIIGLARGGTGANLSATGGTGHVLKQSTVGGAVSVAAITATDLASTGTPNATTYLRGDLSWQPVTSGFTNPMTTAGDLILATTGGVATRLGIGAANSVLKSNGTTATWSTVAHSELTGLTSGDPHTQYLTNSPGSSSRNLLTPGLGMHENVLVVQQSDSGTFPVSGELNYFGVLRDNSSAAWVLTTDEGQFIRVKQSVPLDLLTNNAIRSYNTANTFFTTVRARSDLSTNTSFVLPASNGVSGQVLQTDGSGNTSWTTVSSGFANPMTTNGDLITQSGGSPARLGIGSSGTFLRSNGSAASWNALAIADLPSLTSTQLATLLSDETGSGSAVFGTSPTISAPSISGGTHTALTSLGIRSTGAAFDLTLASSEALTAGRTLSINVGDAARTLTISGNATISGTNTGDQTSVTGNAGTATALQTARNINGVAFDGTADITVAAAAGTLTGSTLAAGVTGSSLTSLGTIGTGVWQGTTIGLAYGGTNANLSATGGTGHVLKQSTVGGAVSVAALVANDIPSLDTAKVTTGVFSTARLGTGTPGSTSFLKNGAWATIATSDLPAIDADSITIGQLSVTSGGTGSDLSATGGAGHVLKQSVVGDPVTVAALVASDIPNLDAAKITTGSISVARGGTGASLSATGGSGHVLRQSSTGAAVTVSQLGHSELSGLTSGDPHTQYVIASPATDTRAIIQPPVDQPVGLIVRACTQDTPVPGETNLFGVQTFSGSDVFAVVNESFQPVAVRSFLPLELRNQNELRFYETTGGGSNKITLKAPSTLAGDLNFILPPTHGTANNYLKTNGTGTLSFSAIDASEIATGTLAVARGGTGASLSATGGTGHVLKQSTVGGNVTVAALVANDIPNLDAGKITTGTVATDRLGSGTANSGTFLRGDQTWAAAPSGFSNPMTTAGDLILATSGGTATRLGIGAANSVLKSNGTTAAWNTVAHSELTGLTTGNPHTQYLWNAPSDGSTQNIINPALGNHRDVLIIQQGDSSTIAGTSTDDPYFGVWKDGGTVPAWMLFCNDGAFQQVRQSVPLRIYNAAGTFYSEVSIGTLAGNTTFRLPTSNGSSSQFLQTNGSGVTSWASLVASDIPSLDASKITTGTVSTARLGSGTANNSTYLRGDNTWGAPPVTQSLTATVDFGASFTDKASVVVTGQTWVTGTSRIVIQPVIPASADPDEFRLLDFRVFVSDIVVGVGFTITVYTETEAKGQYDFNCVGV